MSNMPFDLVAVHPGKREILFIEVKSPTGRLSERQKDFKKIVQKYNEWIVKYIVEVIE